VTDGRGVDIALDSIGGASFRKSYDLLAPGGRLLCFGNSAMARPGRRSIVRALLSIVRMPRFSPIELMNRNRGVLGAHIGHLWGETRLLRPQMEHLLELLAAGHITPIIDQAFAFEDAAAAHERLESRANIGKVLLHP
jgi:NADPH:quinone reductase-like Zn-dependent oxidoreductase